MEKHKESIGENCQNGILNAKTSGTPRPNVPALRFPEFTGEWENITIREACSEFQSGKNIKAEMINDQGLYPVYGGNGLRGFTGSYNHDGDYILIGRQGALCGNVRKVTGKTYVTEHAIAVCASKEHETTFLQHLFQKMRLGQYSDQSAQPGLAVNKLLRLNINVPSKNEQGKIAKILSLIDERITTQNKIIEDLKKLKSAIIDKLYSSTNGEIYSFRQLFEVVNEKNKARAYKNVLSASQELGMIERSDINIDIKFEQESISGYKIVHKGDYVVHLRSFQGGFAFSDRTGICSPAYIILRPNDLVVYGYLSHFFTSKPFIKSLKLVTYGIRDGRSINVDEWLDMPILLPPAQEQIRILTIVNAIDAKLHNEVKVQFCLSSQKSYLLNTMFI